LVSAESTDKKHAQRSLDRACEVAGRSRRAAGIAELGQQDICRERTQACLHDRKDSEGSAEEPRCQMAEEKKGCTCCHSRSYLSRDEGLCLHMAGGELPDKGAEHDHEGSLAQKTCPFHVMQRAGTAARTKSLLPSAIPSVFCMSSMSHNAASSREESISTPSLCSAEAFSHPTLLR
jgi:hypothetical protein